MAVGVGRGGSKERTGGADSARTSPDVTQGSAVGRGVVVRKATFLNDMTTQRARFLGPAEGRVVFVKDKKDDHDDEKVIVLTGNNSKAIIDPGKRDDPPDEVLDEEHPRGRPF